MTDSQPARGCDPVLLPCPFCGKVPSATECQRRYDFDFAIECDCGACLSQCMWDGAPGRESREKTIAHWNTRVAGGGGVVTEERVKAAGDAFEKWMMGAAAKMAAQGIQRSDPDSAMRAFRHAMRAALAAALQVKP